MSTPLLEFANVVKRYGQTPVVNGISFTVNQGEFFTLLGPSGCGKTTTLRLLAGLEMPDGGEITLGGRTLAAPARNIFVPTDKRDLGMVFQSYAIWPHLTVYENVAFPLRVRRERAATIKKRVGEALEIVGLKDFEQRGATQLSGGQQQRVALARAIVYTPKILLLDEPLSNLDVKLREQMRTELQSLHERLHMAVVYVTHDQSEALSLSDRIAVVNHGNLEQVGTPAEVYEQPRTRFVGDFLGRTVVLTGTVRKHNGQSVVDVQGAGWVSVDANNANGQFADGDTVVLMARPEDISLLPAGESGLNHVAAKISHVGYMGDHVEYTVTAAGRSFVLPAAKKDRYSIGADVRLAFDPAHTRTMPP